MSDVSEGAPPTPAEEIAFARRHGLAEIPPGDLARFLALAATVAETGRKLPRVPSKFDTPAPSFHVVPK